MADERAPAADRADSVLPAGAAGRSADRAADAAGDRPATRDRVHALLEAVVSIGSDLELETVLRRITEAATTLVDARTARSA